LKKKKISKNDPDEIITLNSTTKTITLDKFQQIDPLLLGEIQNLDQNIEIKTFKKIVKMIIEDKKNIKFYLLNEKFKKIDVIFIFVF